jgi:branched-chain amino acid transport system substrate-binding protein
MNKNKLYWIAAIVIIVFIVVFSGWNNNSGKDRVLAILPLSGSNSQHGEWAKRGLQLASEGKNLEIIFEDSQLDAKKAISIINQYKNDKSIRAVFSLGSPVAMAIAPVVNESKIPTFSIVAAPPYSTPNDYTFRINGTTDVEMSTIKSTILKDGKKRVAVIYLNNDYGKGIADAFTKNFDKDNIVASEGFLPTDTDLRSQIIKIKNANPDVIFIASWGKEAGIFVKQARELGVNTKIYCGSACYSPELINMAGQYAEGVIIISPSVLLVNKDFGTSYLEKYKEAPNYVTTRNYDSMKILISSLDKCTTGDKNLCIKDYVAGIKDYPGLTYSINFDTNGDLQDQYQVSTVADGKFVDIK